MPFPDEGVARLGQVGDPVSDRTHELEGENVEDGRNFFAASNSTSLRVRTAGVEPAPLAGQDPKSCASASFATFAWLEDNQEYA